MKSYRVPARSSFRAYIDLEVKAFPAALAAIAVLCMELRGKCKGDERMLHDLLPEVPEAFVIVAQRAAKRKNAVAGFQLKGKIKRVFGLPCPDANECHRTKIKRCRKPGAGSIQPYLRKSQSKELCIPAVGIAFLASLLFKEKRFPKPIGKRLLHYSCEMPEL